MNNSPELTGRDERQKEDAPTSVDELRDLLHQAAQLEHSLLDIYLFVAASLKTDPLEFGTDRRFLQSELTRSWKRTIYHVCREEMQHLAQVNSLLLAVGGKPCFTKPNFPFKRGNWFSEKDAQADKFQPLNLALQPFSVETLKNMIRFESSSVILDLANSKISDIGLGMDKVFEAVAKVLRKEAHRRNGYTTADRKLLGDQTEIAAAFAVERVERVELQLEDCKFGWQNKPYATIKQLYERIKLGFIEIPNVIAPEADTQIDLNQQGIRNTQRPNITATIRSVGDALQVIQSIIGEGEGSELFVNKESLEKWLKDPENVDSDALDRKSHLFRFMAILVELNGELAVDPSFVPARKVMTNPTSRYHSDQEQPRSDKDWDNADWAHLVPDDKFARELLAAFNSTYHVMLAWLNVLYEQTEPKQTRQAIGSLIFLSFMSQIIRPFMDILTYVPSGGNNERYLGPSFETDLHSTSMSSVQTERLTAVADFLEKNKNNFPEGEVKTRVVTLSRNIRHILKEYEARTLHGYTGDSTSASLYPNITPKKHYDESANNFILSGEALKIDFDGWAVARLATDPDPADESRGVSGNNFAYCQEPNLDRSIHFQPKDELIRATKDRLPRPGVCVRKVSLIQPITSRVMYSTQRPLGDLKHNFKILKETNKDVSWSVDLQPFPQEGQKEVSPHFEGQNHIVCPDGEPIDPMNLAVRTSDNKGKEKGTVFQRCCRESEKSVMNMQPLERAGIGRYPFYLSASPADFQENIASMKSKAKFPGEARSAFGFHRLRLAELRQQLTQEHDNSVEGEKLKRRIEDVWRALDYSAVDLFDQLVIIENEPGGLSLKARFKSEMAELKAECELKHKDNIDAKFLALQTTVTRITKKVEEHIGGLESPALLTPINAALVSLQSFSWDQLKQAALLACEDKAHFSGMGQLQLLLDTMNQAVENVIPQRTADIRATRLYFRAKYLHTLGGKGFVHPELNAILPKEITNDTEEIVALPSSEDLGTDPKTGALGSAQRWLVAYNMGFFDTDLSMMHVDGYLIVPVLIKKKNPSLPIHEGVNE